MTKSVEVVQLIRTQLTTRGDGKPPDDPVRRIVQYWTMEGYLVFEWDEWKNSGWHQPTNVNPGNWVEGANGTV